MNSNRHWFAALAVAPIVFAAGLAHADGPRTHRPMCDPLKTTGKQKHCLAQVNTNPDGSIHVNAAPQGYGPPDLVSAYSIPANGLGDGQIVALVDAMDSPDVESDLGMYRSTYNLPACTTANGCFMKLNQDGVAGSYPTADTDWAGEIALDVEMVSAICPKCRIMLVEANDQDTGLYTSLLTAVSKGANAISNSYGGPESDDTSDDTQYFAGHTGILITASAGDGGYGASYPATSPNVLAIGGTSLVKDSSARGWAETVWIDTGSGCSAEFARPAWQSALPAGCAHRMEADISASADNEQPVAVYCSDTDCGSGSGWIEVGGTSESSPIVASMFTHLGLNTQPSSYVYANTDKFYDVTSGTNAGTKTCSTKNAYFCNGETGYDGPTGWGTPNAPELATGGQSGGIDAGPGTGGDDGGTVTGGGEGGTTTGGDDGGTAPTGNEDSGSSFTGGEDAGTGLTGTTNEDSGATTTVAADAGGNGFGGGGSGASSGCSCNAPGTQSPLGETGVSMLALGAVVFLASRRRRG